MKLIPFWFFLLSFCLSCGDERRSEPPSLKGSAPVIQLPTCAGMATEVQVGEDTLKIDIVSDVEEGSSAPTVRFVHEKKALEGRALLDLLVERGHQRMPDGEVEGFSRTHLYVRADASLPMAFVVHLLRGCERAEVGISRVSLAVRDESGGEGALQLPVAVGVLLEEEFDEEEPEEPEPEEEEPGGFGLENLGRSGFPSESEEAVKLEFPSATDRRASRYPEDLRTYVGDQEVELEDLTRSLKRPTSSSLPIVVVVTSTGPVPLQAMVDVMAVLTKARLNFSIQDDFSRPRDAFPSPQAMRRALAR